MERPQFTAWITKYALTAGIWEKQVEQCIGTCADMVTEITVNPTYAMGSHFHGEGKDWHRTRQGALERAEQMRVAKIASLKAQVVKLEKLRFS